MAFTSFPRYRFLHDPFFFYSLDLFDPWFDFDWFPLYPPVTSRYQRIKRQERLSYTTTTTNNNTTTNDTYQFPQRTDTNRLTSYITPSNTLTVEIPVQNSNSDRRLQRARSSSQSLTQFSRQDRLFDDDSFLNDAEIQPRTVNKGNNKKQLEWSIDMKNFRPEEINVSVNNNRLIIQGQHQHEEANRSESASFYKSTTLPPGTRIDQLQSRFNDGQLQIEAPLS
ncbi:unnamed protein product [Adineta ricciae]|uniref:SHSP domain-containing protein n=1 Tax=Adineta ricciae TaxID=249248 RepID=A0A813X3E2_ADIRI|nr:unnamed protein product [Adineta ricciae]CAF0902703.1 unnamed protein product [Adineta ricciae]